MIDLNCRTKTAKLQRGFELGGVFHKEVVLREEVLKDNIRQNVEIAENFGEDKLEAEEKEADFLKACVQFRRRVVKIGNVGISELEKLTAKDFFEKLTSADYMILLGTKARLDAEMQDALLKSAKGEEDEKGEDAKKK